MVATARCGGREVDETTLHVTQHDAVDGQEIDDAAEHDPRIGTGRTSALMALGHHPHGLEKSLEAGEEGVSFLRRPSPTRPQRHRRAPATDRFTVG